MANLTHADICLPDFLPDGGFIISIVGAAYQHSSTIFVDFFAVPLNIEDDPYSDYSKGEIAHFLNRGATHIIFKCVMPDDKEETVFLNHLFLTL